MLAAYFPFRPNRLTLYITDVLHDFLRFCDFLSPIRGGTARFGQSAAKYRMGIDPTHQPATKWLCDTNGFTARWTPAACNACRFPRTISLFAPNWLKEPTPVGVFTVRNSKVRHHGSNSQYTS